LIIKKLNYSRNLY